MLSYQANRDTENTYYFPGLSSAKVKKTQGEGLALGHIQVSISTLVGEDKPELFAIARPCFPYGHFFVPNEGDRVWVAFENGDPTAPVWLGIWYPNGGVIQDEEKKAADGSQPLKRVIRSAKGHVVVLDDKEDKITIQHGNGKAKIVLSEKFS